MVVSLTEYLRKATIWAAEDRSSDSSWPASEAGANLLTCSLIDSRLFYARPVQDFHQIRKDFRIQREAARAKGRAQVILDILLPEVQPRPHSELDDLLPRITVPHEVPGRCRKPSHTASNSSALERILCDDHSRSTLGYSWGLLGKVVQLGVLEGSLHHKHEKMYCQLLFAGS